MRKMRSVILGVSILTLILVLSTLVVVTGNASVPTVSEPKAESSSKSFISHAPIYIDGNSDFTVANGVTGGNGTESDPYIIENWDINASTTEGIDIENTNIYFIIRNCIVHEGKSNYKVGIYLYNVTNGEIENVTTYNTFWSGIRLYESSNNTIRMCSSYNNYYDGIYLDQSSSNNTIIGCSFYDNSRAGVAVCYSSSNNKITACNIYNNSICGIKFYSFPNNNQITNCNVYNNSYYGIWLSDSANNNSVTNCTVYNNYEVGIYLSDSPDNDNIFHHNNITNNGQNAYDPYTNYWDDGAYGNYWSDYTGVDVDGDGMGDTPYNIPSGTNQDRYPLMAPWSSFSLHFHQGWNYVTLPPNKNQDTAEELTQAIDYCTHIAKYNTTTTSFESHQKGTVANNFTIKAGEGYLIYVEQNTDFLTEGVKVITATINLKQGWNSIAWLNDTSTDAETLVQSITNCTAVAYWNNTLGRFVIHPIGTDISNFVIERGNGYLVFVTSDEM